MAIFNKCCCCKIEIVGYIILAINLLYNSFVLFSAMIRSEFDCAIILYTTGLQNIFSSQSETHLDEDDIFKTGDVFCDYGYAGNKVALVVALVSFVVNIAAMIGTSKQKPELVLPIIVVYVLTFVFLPINAFKNLANGTSAEVLISVLINEILIALLILVFMSIYQKMGQESGPPSTGIIYNSNPQGEPMVYQPNSVTIQQPQNTYPLLNEKA